jgi:hypothetical protein
MNNQFNGYTNNSRSNNSRSNNSRSNKSPSNNNTPRNTRPNNNNVNTRRLKRSYGKRNLFSHTRNNTNAKWSRFGKYGNHIQFNQSNANGNNSPLTLNQRLYSAQLWKSRLPNRRRTPLKSPVVRLSPTQAMLFANISSSTNSYTTMAEKVAKLPILNSSKEAILKYIEFLKE